MEINFNKSWLGCRSWSSCSIIICTPAAVVLPRGSMKVIGTRGLDFFTCLRIQPYWPPSVTSSFLVSFFLPHSSTVFFLFAVLSPFTQFSPVSSLPLCRVIINQKNWWQPTWHSLIKLSSGKHFTTLQTRTHSSCYDSASCYWQTFTDILFFKIGFWWNGLARCDPWGSCMGKNTAQGPPHPPNKSINGKKKKKG